MKKLRNILWISVIINYILPIVLYIVSYILFGNIQTWIVTYASMHLYFVIGVVGAIGLILTIGLIVYHAKKKYKFEKNNIFLGILFLFCILIQAGYIYIWYC